MRRNIPEVRALYERVRRPAITLLVGLGFMAPMGLSLIVPPSAEEGSVALSATKENDAASPDPRASEASAAESTPATEAAAPAAEVKASAEAKGETSKPSTRSAAVARYARQYKIPVSLADQIYRAAVAEGIEPRVAFGLVQTESSFRRTVISSAGAVGYTQLLPSTARWIAPGTTRSQLFDTKTNLRVGFKYLNYLLKKYNGNMRLALTAYNRGPGTVDRLLKQGRNPENGYATKVLRSRA